ncbi:centrosomal protein of 95 kDa [Pelodytes ibericus]
MGTEETDWVTIANNLLNKCHINLQVRNVTDCDAHVFVALYEAILGERVPDSISNSQSQEDDAHNVQSVIDSLALDYLQVSLSHITGENIVTGDIDSIQNLLEIFDGLLEYLTEQISEASSQNGDDTELYREIHHSRVPQEELQGQTGLMPSLRLPQSAGSVITFYRSSALSSDLLVPSWEGEGSESTAELIRLGDTAHTFTVREPCVRNGLSLDEMTGTSQNQDQLPSAIPLNLPYQPTETRPITTNHGHQLSIRSNDHSFVPSPVRSNDHPSSNIQNGFSSHGVTSDAGVETNEISRHRDLPYGSALPAETPGIKDDTWYLLGKKKSLEMGDPGLIIWNTRGDNYNKPEIGNYVLKNLLSAWGQIKKKLGINRQIESLKLDIIEANTSSSSHKKVAFRTLPEIHLLTQSLRETRDSWPSISEGEISTEPGSTGLSLTDRPPPVSESLFRDSSRNSETPMPSFLEEPLSVQRARNKLSEQELKEMSEKLSHRLDELDQMLKKALGDQGLVGEPRDEDKLSQHSDGIMEFRRKKQGKAVQKHMKKLPTRPRSLTSSPVSHAPPQPSLSAQFEDVLHKEATGETGKIRRGVQKELDQQRVKSQLLTKAYEDELKDFEEREMAKLSKLKSKLKKTEQEFKENIHKEPLRRSQPEKIYSRKRVQRNVKPSHRLPNCNKASAQMKIKENNLLPLLLEEFPYLHISPHTLNKMWKGQSAQIEQLNKSVQEDEHSERKLQNEVEDAQRKHELLKDLTRKEQEHNQRLRDFKERISLQKSSQNKMRENRQQVARAKRYYDDYHVQLRAKMMRARTREERIVKKLFVDGLELQKQRLREMRSYTKEQREEQRKRHKDELESMENYYKDQFSMLAEAVTQERHEIQAQEKVQSKTLQKMKRELRVKMEKEIQDLQDMIIRADEDAFFRELEAERLKKRLQMASYQYSKSHGL